MRIGALILGLSLCVAGPLAAGEKTDVLYMKNGDRMTCEIKSLSAGSLYVSLEYVDGTISVDWKKVLRLESKRLFIVRTEDGLVYTGSLAIVDTVIDSKPQVLVSLTDLSGNRVEIDKTDIVTIGKTSGSFWKRFVVDISSGIIYAKGNQTTQYNIASTIQYPKERWGVTATFNSNLSSSSGTTASTRNQFGLTAFHLLRWKNYFAGAAAALLQSTEQGISLQSGVSGGIGYYLKNTEHVRLSVLGGVAYQATAYDQSASSTENQDVLTALVAANLSVVTFSKTNLSIQANVLPALSEPGRFYFNTNATYFLKLFSNLTFNISMYGNVDTRPPAGLSGSDYGFSSGLGWTFGSRQPQ
jgi:hypothetical protein